MRLLLAEDERDLNRIITLKLTAEGYSVDSFYTGTEALDALMAAEYDAAILDIMMPGADGFQVLQSIRSLGKTTPVLFLTARDSVSDKVKGLDSGANDYLVKPFSFEELMARLRAMTRGGFGMVDNTLAIADLVMDCAAHTVKRDGKEINLSAKEYALLEYLMRNRGIVLSREKIENHIWNFDYEGGTNAVDVYIRYLRKKLDEGFGKKLIHTVRGVGYVLREEP
ncbi:MAG: response regulator transcription factor [Lachnospiraceae bacterium]|nr:response regulator transcription factor [Lachnospiraceae bacterium]